jgi:hypothetical protein
MIEYWQFGEENQEGFMNWSHDHSRSEVCVEIRGLRPLIGLVSPGTERHGAVH